MSKYGLDTQIMGKDFQTYLSGLLEQNENQQIEIERAKVAVSMLKQMNNHSRLLLDVAKLELKQAQFEQEQKS